MTFNPSLPPLGPFSFSIHIVLKPQLTSFRPVISSASLDTWLPQILQPLEEDKLHFIIFLGALKWKSASCWAAWSWLFLPGYQVGRQEQHLRPQVLIHCSELAENLIACFMRPCVPIWNRFTAWKQANAICDLISFHKITLPRNKAGLGTFQKWWEAETQGCPGLSPWVKIGVNLVQHWKVHVRVGAKQSGCSGQAVVRHKMREQWGIEGICLDHAADYCRFWRARGAARALTIQRRREVR